MRKNISIEKSLRQLGENLKVARLRRRLPMELIAARAGISTGTLASLERGSRGVSIGNLAAVLFALGFATPLAELAAYSTDELGRIIDLEKLPKRAKRTKREVAG